MERIEKAIDGRTVVGYRIRGTVYVNTTPHEIFFLNPDGGEEPVVLPPSGLVVNARTEELVVDREGEITFVRTGFFGDAETKKLLADVNAAFFEDGKKPIIIGSIIAAQAYPGTVVALCPAPGFERVPPTEKRMLLNKFTVF
ncbi:hypothetical protein [Ammonifex thiophilus]|uniref:Uncharacterized protein n=1 Tax=Ammonifex thiophilus TaxID=444093 RepID=A0A3D8P478_9THEO|nr:hypothetical protein [Ammonifex thiophilus]RDV83929.1 hypothetical protein DXX99_03585 [Ammonifex thiophilus]